MPPARRVKEILTSHLYTVSGDSMDPSLRTGDRVLVNWKAYVTSRPERGDLVVIHGTWGEGRRLLKRVVGLPGEEIHLGEGLLYIDGEHLAEPYLGGLPATPGLDDRQWSLGTDQYFALGDNRAHSTDSREYGPVELAAMAGKAWFRCWPLATWGRVG